MALPLDIEEALRLRAFKERRARQDIVAEALRKHLRAA